MALENPEFFSRTSVEAGRFGQFASLRHPDRLDDSGSEGARLANGLVDQRVTKREGAAGELKIVRVKVLAGCGIELPQVAD